MNAAEFTRALPEVDAVIFDGDETAKPERIVLHLLNGRYVVIAAREDGCLDVVLEEA